MTNHEDTKATTKARSTKGHALSARGVSSSTSAANRCSMTSAPRLGAADWWAYSDPTDPARPPCCVYWAVSCGRQRSGPARRPRSANASQASGRATDWHGAAGDAARIRIHSARNGDDGTLPASRRIRNRGSGRRGNRPGSVPSDGHRAPGGTTVQHPVRRRKAARRDRRRALHKRRRSCCSTNRRRRSISPTSSRCAAFCKSSIPHAV